MKKNIQVEKRSLSTQLYETIKTMILRGELKGGDRISEETLAKKFGVSRTPIREAIRRLDEYGIIQLIPRSYAEVISITEEGAQDVILVRRELETLAIKILAEKATKNDITALKRLSSICKKEFKANHPAKVFESDSSFHLEIALRTGNNPLFETLERLDAKIQLIRLMQCSTPENIKSNLDFHDEIIIALETKDSKEAIKLIKAHIN